MVVKAVGAAPASLNNEHKIILNITSNGLWQYGQRSQCCFHISTDV